MDRVGNDLNMIVIFLMSAVRKPNRESDAARAFYAKNLGDNYGMFLGAYRDKYGLNWDGTVTPEEMWRRIDTGMRTVGRATARVSSER